MPPSESKEISVNSSFKSNANTQELYSILSDACRLRIALYGASSDIVEDILKNHLKRKFSDCHGLIKELLRSSVRVNVFIEIIEKQFYGYILKLTDERIQQILITDIEQAVLEKSVGTLIEEFESLHEIGLQELRTKHCAVDGFNEEWTKIFEIANKKISLTETVITNIPRIPVSHAIIILMCLLVAQVGVGRILEFLFTEVTPLLGLPPMEREDVERNKIQDKRATVLFMISMTILSVIVIARKVSDIVFQPTARDLTQLLRSSCYDYLEQRPDDTIISYPLVKGILPPPPPKPQIKNQDDEKIRDPNKISRRYPLPSFLLSLLSAVNVENEDTKNKDTESKKKNEKKAVVVTDEKGNNQLYYKLNNVEGNVLYHHNTTRYSTLFKKTGLENVYSDKVSTVLENDPTVHPADSKKEGLKWIGEGEKLPKGVVAKFKFSSTAGRLLVETRKPTPDEPVCDEVFTPREFTNTHTHG